MNQNLTSEKMKHTFGEFVEMSRIIECLREEDGLKKSNF